jgi:hypothetical protein
VPAVDWSEEDLWTLMLLTGMFYELQCWDVLTQRDVSLIGLATLILSRGPYPKTLPQFLRRFFIYFSSRKCASLFTSLQ